MEGVLLPTAEVESNSPLENTRRRRSWMMELWTSVLPAYLRGELANEGRGCLIMVGRLWYGTVFF